MFFTPTKKEFVFCMLLIMGTFKLCLTSFKKEFVVCILFMIGFSKSKMLLLNRLCFLFFFRRYIEQRMDAWNWMLTSPKGCRGQKKEIEYPECILRYKFSGIRISSFDYSFYCLRGVHIHSTTSKVSTIF